jgi:hypothetical protein
MLEATIAVGSASNHGGGGNYSLMTGRLHRLLFAVALVAGCSASASAAASQDVCSPISKVTFAQIVGLPHGSATSERYGPGTCEIDAWSGSKPRPSQIESRLKHGTLALLEIRTPIVEPSESSAESEKPVEPEKVVREVDAGIETEFRRFGLTSQRVSPPTFGAEISAGVSGREGSLREDRDYWASKRAGVFVSVFHANKQDAPVQAELVKAAKIIVPALGI